MKKHNCEQCEKDRKKEVEFHQTNNDWEKELGREVFDRGYVYLKKNVPHHFEKDTIDIKEFLLPFVNSLLSSERQRLKKSIKGLPCKEECMILKIRILKLLD